MSLKRFCGSWCPDVGELIAIWDTKLRDLDGLYGSSSVHQFGNRNWILGIVLHRADGSMDWTIATFVTSEGTQHKIQLTSASSGEFQRLVKVA